MVPAFNLKEAIVEALVSLGGCGTESEVRDYLFSKYGKNWKDIGAVMADLCPESESSFFPPGDRVLKQVGKEKYCLKTVTELPKTDDIDQDEKLSNGNLKKSSSTEVGTQPLRITSLVDYQKGSIVSRPLVSNDNGSATLFAFDEGQGLSEHTSPYDALVLLIEGEAVIAISNNVHNLGKDELILIPANEPHSLKAKKRFKMILTMIKV